MKNKFIATFVLMTLIVPSFSNAFVLPTAKLTIIVNTQGQDSPFIFNFSDGTKFILQTQNLSATKTVTITVPSGQYSLTQESVKGLKIDSISCSSDNQADSFSYTSTGTIFSPKNKENITCTFNDVKTKTPVLIVPGLMGTEMKDGNELLWANIPKMLNDSSDNFMDLIAFDKDLNKNNSVVSMGGVIRRETLLGIELSNYTDKLIAEFIHQGYAENENLFTFPYDWRYGASAENADGKTNSDLLAQKIQDILTQTGSDKVDVIAHSLGGLIVKKYVVEHPVDHHIGKAVFVGVPNTGSLKTVKVLLMGDSLDISFAGFGLSEDEVKKISANLPTIYDLLPSQRYYDNKGSFIEVIQKDNFATTQKELNYTEFKSYITDDHNLNSLALNNAANLHTTDFDNFDMRTVGVNVYAIDGCKAGTIDKIIENRQGSVLGSTTTDYRMIKFKDGDGTVPLESSTNLPIDQSNKFYSLVGEHSKMMSQEGSRQEIVNIISGSSLTTKDSKGKDLITQDINKCELNGKAISVFSPVDILVTDQDGNKMGNAADGSVLSEIPNADFEMFGEHKFLYLPTDDGQAYTVQITGTGTGTYTINSQNIANNEVAGTEVFSDLPVTPELTGQVNLGDQTTLTVKPMPSDVDQIITASADLDGSQQEDYLPPVSVATLTGAQDADGNYTGDATVNIKTTDENSGVLNVEYNLDGAGFQKVAGDSASVTVSAEGSHTILFFGTDKAGNNEQEQTVSFTIKKPVPVIAAPVVVVPIVNSLPVSGGSSGGGGGSGPSAFLSFLQNQNKDITVQAPPSPLPIVTQNIPTPIAPKLVAVKKPSKILAINKTPKATKPLAQIMPLPKPQNHNPFLASFSNVGSWFAKLFLHK